MLNELETSPKDIELCSWCGIPLGSANRHLGVVCIRCYTLLVNAGLDEAEIFSQAVTNRRWNDSSIRGDRDDSTTE